MEINDFLNKHGFNTKSCSELLSDKDLASFLYVLDYIYCHMTREQAISVMTDYYDNADTIINSLNDTISTMTSMLETLSKAIIKAAEEEVNEIKEDKTIYKA